jgi:hypothetical protein
MVGRVGYYGPIADVKSYFGNFLNLACPETVNIADHIINETVRRKKGKSIRTHSYYFNYYYSLYYFSSTHSYYINYYYSLLKTFYSFF